MLIRLITPTVVPGTARALSLSVAVLGIDLGKGAKSPGVKAGLLPEVYYFDTVFRRDRFIQKLFSR